MRRLLRREPLDQEEVDALAQQRPRTRGDCEEGPRPCPWVCRYSLVTEVTEAGSVKHLHGVGDPEALSETCALDVADRGETTLEDVGDLLGVSRERARQTEEGALARIRVEYPELAPVFWPKSTG